MRLIPSALLSLAVAVCGPSSLLEAAGLGPSSAEGTDRLVHDAGRVVTLQRGSNFRDIGGYPAAGGKRVRWGSIFRSGAMPLLTSDDLQSIRRLGVEQVIDLRSREERLLAPTRIDGVRYTAFEYSLAESIGDDEKNRPTLAAIYRSYPELLAPHINILLHELAAGRGPIVFHCSAGQDRTGFVTAVLLSTLGVPREVIMADYHLSTTYRRPEYEMPRIEQTAYPDAATQFLLNYYRSPPAKAKPLYDAEHRPYLDFALDEVEKKWGSAQTYLEQAVGIAGEDLEEIRKLYLE